MGVKVKNPSNEFAAHMVSSAAQSSVTQTKITSPGKGKPKVETLVHSDEQMHGGGPMIPKHDLHIVEVGGGMTLNLGNYESARLDVRLVAPCAKADIDATYEWASDWVSGKIQKSIADAKGQ